MEAEVAITFGSLFAGIGGFDLGFERAGMECRWQVEIDDYASKVLAKHWPNVHRERDIRECGSHNLEWVDVICGGFPCQDISSLNPSRAHRLRCLGNAVVPQVAEFVGRRVVSLLTEQ